MNFNQNILEEKSYKLDTSTQINEESNYKIEITKFLNRVLERIEKMESILVIDRFESDYAVCENRTTGEMLNINRKELPEGIKEGTILKYKNDKYTIEKEEQKRIENRIADKMQKLWNN